MPKIHALSTRQQVDSAARSETQVEAASTAPPLDTIFIRGLRGETVIGIFDDELRRPQPVLIDVTAGRLHLPACGSDRIGDTIDYGAVRTRLLQHLQSHQHRLLEAFAESVAAILLDEFGADWARVSVAKPHKFADVESVGVQIERRRATPRAANTPPADNQGAEILAFLGRGLSHGKP